MKALLEKIRKILRSRRTRQLLTRAVSGVAAIVVFITTYALVLPAITMEQDAFCGIPEHQHTDACYEERLVCEIPEGEEHHHDASCYEKILICGKEVHTHSTECYQKDSSAVVSSGSGAAASTALEAYAEPDVYETGVSEFASGAAVMDSAAGGQSVMEEPADEEAASAQDAAEGTEEVAEGTEEVDLVSEGIASEAEDLNAEGTDEGEDAPEKASENNVSETVPDGSDNGGNGLEDTEQTEQEGPAGADDSELAAESGQDLAGTDLETSGSGNSENIDADTTNPEDRENKESEEDKTAVDILEDADSELTEQVNKEDEDLSLEAGDSHGMNEDSVSGSDTLDNLDTLDTSDRTAEDTDGAETEDTAPAAGTEEAANDATTNVLPEPVETEKLSSGYVPELDSIDFGTVLNKHTDFFYFHPEEGQELPASSAEVTDWKKVKNGFFGSTKLESTDLVKMYLSYTIPAGALNETNQIARYRLPSNIHLTDDQIIAINATENGMSALYADAVAKEGEGMADEGNENIADDAGDEAHAEGLESDSKVEDSAEDAGTASGTDEGDGADIEAASDIPEPNQDENAANYQKYLGAEAIEGTRMPDETLKEGAQEYISAIVKAENIFDEEGLYGEKGAFLGQDLIFIFTPYSIEKNQTIFNADGDPLSAGEKITGWFACDFNMSQIDWVEEDTDLDNSTVEKTAEVVFVEKDSEKNVKEISRTLKLVDVTEGQSDAAYGGETAAVAETAATAATASETASTDETALASTGNTSEQAVPEESESGSFKSGILTADGDGYKITLDYTEEAKIPENAELSVREITAETDKEAYEACLEQAGQQVAADDKTSVDRKASRFFDIEILVKDTKENDQGEIRKIEPSAPVSVNIQIIDNPAVEDAASGDEETDRNDPAVLHFAEEGVEQIDSTVKAGQEPEDNEDRNVNGESEPATEISFEAESFSIYGVVYTVDFHWEVNGKTYEFSIPGGGYISFTDLIEVLGIVDRDVSEFIDDVEKVEFSNPDLVWVGKVLNNSTVGGLKESAGLACEYNAELSKEQIAEINMQTVEAGDWALISMQPFTSEESLVVTMKTGEVFTIKVTDEQIIKTVIDAKGDTWEITLTYGENAGIPDDADLEVEELLPETEAYNVVLSNSAKILGVGNSEVSFARFFDISIIDKNGEKVEPKTAVQVEIKYKDAVEIGLADKLSVVHFADEGTEVISDAVVSENGKEIVYEQGSFSVTGTVVTPQNNGSHYMILIQDEIQSDEGSIPVTFIVNNDGTLTPVTAEYNTDGSVKTVYVDEPMTWTYKSNHLYHPYDAVRYNVDKAGSAFAYRYINPTNDNALSTETESDLRLGGNDGQGGQVVQNDPSGSSYNQYQQSGRYLWNTTSITYNAGNHSLSNGGQYLGVGFDDNGNLTIVGMKNSGEAAKVYFASPEVAQAGGIGTSGIAARQNVVNHIDISIAGTSEIEVPLAYGDYYNSAGEKILSVSRNEQKTVTASSSVRIELDDMKRAVITAYQIDTDGTRIDLDNAFYITGYSQNQATEIGDKAPQVRIEGSFKTAKAMHNESDTWLNQRNNATGRYENRLASRVYYTVSVVKTITFTLKEGEEDLYDDQGQPITVTLDVTMAASFNYWDPNNNCPPVTNQLTYQGRPFNNSQNVQEWQRGGYPNTYNGDFADISGMDFVLGGNADDAEANIVAVEITKMVVDTDGNLIKLEEGYTQSFDLYRSDTDSSNNVVGINVPAYSAEYTHYDQYSDTKLHSKDIRVGTSGMGLVYDYDVTPGMYYITEDPSDIPQTVNVVNGTATEEWQYVGTRLETEYVWRNDKYSGRHVSDTYTDPDSDSYMSVPEVAGAYKGLLNPSSTEQPESAYNSTTWNYGSDSGTFRNGFLEFYVYNVYEPVTADVTLKKVNADELDNDSADTLKGATFTITKYTDNTFSHVDTSNSFTQTLADVQDATTGEYNLNGIFQFTELPVGFYRIDESVSPPGYVKMVDDLVFEVRKKTGTNELEVILYEKINGTFVKATDGTTEMMRIASDSITIIVGNPPGAALPNTGGPGTRLFTIPGSILILGAGVLLWRRRRLI